MMRELGIFAAGFVIGIIAGLYICYYGVQRAFGLR